MKKTRLALALVLCSLAILGAIGCEDVSPTTTTTVAVETTTTVPETTTTVPETTTTVPEITTTTTTTVKPKPAPPSTSPSAGSSPAPKEHLLKGTWEWDVDSDGKADLWYRIVDELVHQLEPENGAGLARISGKTFAAVTLVDLQGMKYSSVPLWTESVDDPNVLMPGSVIALKTSAGRYAKLEVVGFEEGTITGGIVLPRYNMRMRYVLYL